jgi:type I restriction enzyme S subunit
VPSHDEQTAIAAYLDRKTAQIDDLISKKQKLIELLKEERAAIINQAVTKGLNPDAPMKDLGIEWLGEVPEHWEVKRLKYVASINEENLSEKTDANLEIKYIDIGNVCLGSIVNEPVTMYFKDAPSRARRIVRKGDTIISTVRTYLKAISYISDVPQNLIVSTGFAVIKPGDDFDKKFISFLLTSEMIVDTICSLSVGVSYPAINASDIANIMIWFPPNKTEQAAIVEHVNKTTTKIDQTTSKIEKQIDLLKEFRTALISEVVTGKIDVRDEGSNG